MNYLILLLSISSIILTFSGMIYLYNRNVNHDRGFAMVLFGFNLVQFSNLLGYVDINCKNGLNKLGSKIAFYVIGFIQPILSLLAVMFYSEKNDYTSFLLLLFLWIFIYLIILSNILDYNNNCMKKSGSKYDPLKYPKDIFPNRLSRFFYQMNTFIIPVFMSSLNYKFFYLLYPLIGGIIETYVIDNKGSNLWSMIGPVAILPIIMFFNP